MENMVMTEDIGMDQLLAESGDHGPGSLVEGTVVGQTGPYLLVNVGLKQEAILPIKEFVQGPPAVGQDITVLILRLSGPEGRPLVSWRQARERKNWDKMAEAHKNGETVQGKIIQRIKGGLHVDIGLDAFMPASHIDEKPVGRPDQWVGRAIQVKILEMDRAKGNVLVSRRRVLEEEKAKKKAITLGSLKVGQIIKGKVTALAKFGAFVDIGGIEGLLHVSDISWAHIDNPQQVLKTGMEMEVKILKHDPATERISLGRKQILPHPWEGIHERYPLGKIVKGKVTGLADFGAFVELEPGVEGLIHVSELSWTESIKHPEGFLKMGQDVEIKVLSVDRDKEKISLSLKRTGPSPWEKIAEQFPLGSRIEGEVSRLASFGAFIKIPGGLEALLKISDLSWTERIQSVEHVLKIGERVTAVVLDIDAQAEKMSLGLKQLSPDPLKALKIGQAVNATIHKIAAKGLIVKLESGLEAFVPSSELHLEKSMFDDAGSRHQEDQTPPSQYKEGVSLAATVTKINKKERKIELSVRRYEKAQEKALLKKYSGSNDKLTLGQTTGWEQEEQEN